MVANEAPDPRLILALNLLRSALDRAENDRFRPESNPERLSFTPPPPIPTEKRSATDLLNWWFRPTSSASDPWDDYFNLPFPGNGVPLQPERRSPPSSNPSSHPAFHPSLLGVDRRTGAQLSETKPTDSNPSTELWQVPWMNWKDLAAEPEEELAYESAEAAVECLYDFIHAWGSRDVETAMSLVAEDYHVFSEDREIDRTGLRRELEALLDSLHGWDLDISLAEVPVPVFHPNGILIYAEIQVDAYRPRDNLRRSIVDRRIAVLRQQYSGEWMISALSPV